MRPMTFKGLTFRPHQFRRFFAVLYIWRYDLADWGALSHHLRHFTQEYTRRYVSDPELGAIIFQADRQRTAELLTSVAIGNRQLSGLGGERLQRTVRRISARLAQRLQVVPKRKLNQRLSRFLERTDLELRALPWGYCASPAAHGVAACCTGNLGPADPTKATVTTCAHCDRNIRDPIFRPYLAESLSLHREIAADPSTGAPLKRASEMFITELTDWIDSLGPDLSDRGSPSEA